MRCCECKNVSYTIEITFWTRKQTLIYENMWGIFASLTVLFQDKHISIITHFPQRSSSGRRDCFGHVVNLHLHHHQRWRLKTTLCWPAITCLNHRLGPKVTHGFNQCHLSPVKSGSHLSSATVTCQTRGVTNLPHTTYVDQRANVESFDWMTRSGDGSGCFFTNATTGKAHVTQRVTSSSDDRVWNQNPGFRWNCGNGNLARQRRMCALRWWWDICELLIVTGKIWTIGNVESVEDF